MLSLQRFLFSCKNLVGVASPLEKILQLPVRRKKLYAQALSHLSGSQGYERLEYLGDSVLQTIISEFLYEEFPQLKEGKLTQVRSKLVRRSALNLLGYRIGLGDLILSDHLSFKTIDQSNQRIFGDILEALIGAVYLDHGYKGAKFFVIDVLLRRYVNLETLMKSATNHKGILMELSQKLNFKVRFDLIENEPNKSTVLLLINKQAVTSASAKTRKKAEQKAAKKILQSQNIHQWITEEEE